MGRRYLVLASLASLLVLWGPAPAAVTVFPQDLAGFNAAAGEPPLAVDFDSIAAGTDVTGATISGITFLGPGAPLIVVRGHDTFSPTGVFAGVTDISTNTLPPTTGENVLSPGGVVLGPGPDPATENDDLVLVFAQPLSAVGFDHLSQSADGYSYTSVSVYDAADMLLYAGVLPITDNGLGGAGAADFWGVVSEAADIRKIVVDETDGNAEYPDCNIGFDTIRVALQLPSFSDVPPDFWAFHEVEACRRAGIVEGYPDGTYRPEAPLARDQMAAYISRAVAEGDVNITAPPATPSFADVGTGSWAHKYIEYAKAKSVVTGYPDGTYGPTLPVDRGQMAVYVSRAIADPTGDAGLSVYTPPASPSFPDVATDFWAYKYVEYIGATEITGGYPDGWYHPEVGVTRDQMAVYVARAFELVP